MGLFSNIFQKKTTPFELRVVDSSSLMNLINGANNGGKVVAVSPKTAMTIGVVFECIDVITRTLSLVKPHIIEERGNNKEIATTHKLYRFINREPYSLYDATTFYKTIVTDYLLYGNAYAEILRSGNMITGFKIHDPMTVSVTIIKTPDGKQERSYKINDVGNNDNLNSKDSIILQENMLHFMDYSKDREKGISRIELKKSTLQNVGNVTNYSSQMYEKGANITGIITGDRMIEKDALKYFKQKFEENIAKSNGGVEAIPPGFKFDQLKYALPFADAQVIDANKWGVEDVARIFGVPLSLLGRGDSADNKEDREFNTFLTITFAPLCMMIENELNRKLFADNPNTYVKFQLKGLYRVDMITRYQSYQIAINGGWMNKDEVRNIEDMNEIPDGLGKTFYQQLNTIPLEKAEVYFDSIINNGQSKATNNDNTGI